LLAVGVDDGTQPVPGEGSGRFIRGDQVLCQRVAERLWRGADLREVAILIRHRHLADSTGLPHAPRPEFEPAPGAAVRNGEGELDLDAISRYVELPTEASSVRTRALAGADAHRMPSVTYGDHGRGVRRLRARQLPARRRAAELRIRFEGAVRH